MAVLRALRSPLAIVGSLILAATAAASPQSGIKGWGVSVFDSRWSEEPFAAIDAGRQHTLALRPNGTVVAWGDNSQGRCVVPALPPGVACTAISAGDGHSLAARTDGYVDAWGDNSLGQCNVPQLPPGLTYVDVSAGGTFSLAVRSDGSVVEWGLSAYSLAIVPTLPPGLSYIRIAAGGTHALALRSDGVVVAWGQNYSGSCNVPALPPGLTYVDVAAGNSVSFALRSDGALIAWGWGVTGQLNVPALPAGTSYIAMAVGFFHALALRSDGVVLAWGDNSRFQCDVPAAPPGLGFVAVSAGQYDSIARLSDGTILGWGSNSKCECNTPRLPPGVSFTECAISTFSPYDDPDHDAWYAGVRSDGGLSVWGAAYFVANIPLLPPGVSFVHVAAGRDHAVALCSDGTVVAWGTNASGQCNVPPLPPGLRYVGVSAGAFWEYQICFSGHEWQRGISGALRSDGAVIMWGWAAPPTAPPTGVRFAELSAGGLYHAARWSDGAVVEWGYYAYSVPAPPPGQSYVELSVGGGAYLEEDCLSVTGADPWHLLLRISDGTVFDWLGTGTVPALPSGLSYVEVAAGSHFSLARRSDGAVLGWGDNQRGQCDVPQLPPGSVFVGISAGVYESVGRYAPGPACGSVSNYCVAAGNSVGSEGATLTADGCAGLTANNLVLNVSGLPHSVLGMFLYSSTQQQLPFGNGWGCLAGSVQRVLPPMATSPSGTVSFPLDLTQYPFSGSANPILPSSAWNFQFWYRDPAGSPSTFNASDALHIAFAP